MNCKKLLNDLDSPTTITCEGVSADGIDEVLKRNPNECLYTTKDGAPGAYMTTLQSRYINTKVVKSSYCTGLVNYHEIINPLKSCELCRNAKKYLIKKTMVS